MEEGYLTHCVVVQVKQDDIYTRPKHKGGRKQTFNNLDYILHVLKNSNDHAAQIVLVSILRILLSIYWNTMKLLKRRWLYVMIWKALPR